jgi:hypothetical protein
MASNVKIGAPPLRRSNTGKHQNMSLANTKPVPEKPNFTNVSHIVANVVSRHPSGSNHIKALVRMLLMKPPTVNVKNRVKKLKNLKIKEHKLFFDQFVSDLKHFMKDTLWIPENFVKITQEPFHVEISVYHGMFTIFFYKGYLKIKFMQAYEDLFSTPVNNMPIINKRTFDYSIAILNFIIKKYGYDRSKIKYYYPKWLGMRTRMGIYSKYSVRTPKFLWNHIINFPNVNFYTRF